MDRKANPYELPMLPIYRIAGSHFLTLAAAAAAKGVVTANPKHRLPKVGYGLKNAIYEEFAQAIRSDTYARPTLLQEVSAVLRTPSSEIRSLYTTGTGQKRIPVEALAERCVEALNIALERAWDPQKHHVILHSSGYDTRILTGILRKLHRKRGNKWLGSCRFCCFEPETSTAKTIFDYVGFPKGMWFPVNPTVKPNEYYVSSLHFDVVGAHLAEAERFWGGPLLTQRVLESKKYLDVPTQGLTALFSDETLKWNRLAQGDVAWFIGAYFLDNPGIFPGRPDVSFIFPFASLEWLELLTKYYVPVPIDNFKLEMIKQIDPALADLKALPNFRSHEGALRKKHGGQLPQQILTPAATAMMAERYQRSWYATQIGPPTIPLETQPAFPYWSERGTHYMKASIYSFLRSRPGLQLTTVGQRTTAKARHEGRPKGDKAFERSVTYYDNVYTYAKEAENGYWKSWQEQPSTTLIWYPALLLAQGRIFDVGCGAGHLAAMCEDFGLQYAYGLDYSRAAIELAEKHAPNAVFIYDAAEDRPDLFQRDDYDTAVFLEVLEHVFDDIKLIQQVPVDRWVVGSVPNFPAPGHVRHFANSTQVRQRYKSVLRIDHIIESAAKTGPNRWFIFKGVKR